MTDQQLRISGTAAGVVQLSGNNSTATATVRVSGGVPDDVMAALRAIQSELARQPSTKVLTDAAVQQATTPAPDKAAIGTQLKAALGIAKTAEGWAEVAGKIAPAVASVGQWLGGAWDSALHL